MLGSVAAHSSLRLCVHLPTAGQHATTGAMLLDLFPSACGPRLLSLPLAIWTPSSGLEWAATIVLGLVAAYGLLLLLALTAMPALVRNSVRMMFPNYVDVPDDRLDAKTRAYHRRIDDELEPEIVAKRRAGARRVGETGVGPQHILSTMYELEGGDVTLVFSMQQRNDDGDIVQQVDGLDMTRHYRDGRDVCVMYADQPMAPGRDPEKLLYVVPRMNAREILKVFRTVVSDLEGSGVRDRSLARLDLEVSDLQQLHEEDLQNWIDRGAWVEAEPGRYRLADSLLRPAILAELPPFKQIKQAGRNRRARRLLAKVQNGEAITPRDAEPL